MPTWLQVFLGVWAAALPLGAGAYRAVRDLSRKVARIEQWFDNDSEVSKAVGTVPDQLHTLRDSQRTIMQQCLPGLARRVDDMEGRLGDG